MILPETLYLKFLAGMEEYNMKKLFHNGMVLFLLFCLLAGALPCAGIQAASKNKKAGSAFARAVAAGTVSYKKRDAGLVDDLDYDGVKELIIIHDGDDPSFEVWKYAKGKVSRLAGLDNFDPGWVCYIKSKKQFWYMGECDGSWMSCYQVAGKKVKQKVSYTYSVLSKGKYPVVKEKNGKKTKISFKKYVNLRESIMKNNNAKPISKSKLIQKLAGMK